MDRLGMLPREQLITEIKLLERKINDYKAAQYVGADSLVPQRIASANAYDVQFDNVEYNNHPFYLIFTPQTTTFNTSLVYSMYYVITANPLGSVGSTRQRLKPLANGVQRWLIIPNGSNPPNAATWARFKFYFFASGKGSFSIQTL